MTSLRTGLALAVTVDLFYALCALVWLLAPGQFLTFMNNLFHGIDLTSLVQPQPFALTDFFTSLLSLSGWALLARVFLPGCPVVWPVDPRTIDCSRDANTQGKLHV